MSATSTPKMSNTSQHIQQVPAKSEIHKIVDVSPGSVQNVETLCEVDLPRSSSTEHLDGFEAEQERRFSELHEFLQDLASFREQLRKQNTRDKATEVLPRHLKLFAREMMALEEASEVNQFPCTKYTQKLRDFHAKLKKAMERKEALQMVMKQKEGIRIVKEKIREAKEGYLCSQERRRELREMKLKKALDGLDMDLRDVSTSKKMQLAERVVSVKKVRRLQRLGQQQRRQDIVKKLLLEERVDKEVKVMRPCGRKTKTRSHLQEDEFGTIQVGEVEEIKLEEALEEEVTKDIEKIADERSDQSGRFPRGNRRGGGKREKTKKEKTRKEEIKKEKSKKSRRDDKDGTEDLVLPKAPITNPRRKMSPEDVEVWVKLIKEYENLAEVFKERDDYNIQRSLGGYKHDASFYWTPNPVVFKDFQRGQIYKKKITIINGGDVPKRCRIHKVEMEDGFDPTYFDVDNVGVQTTIPGLSFELTMTFSPKDLNRPIEGKIIMITYRTHDLTCSQFTIPVRCTPVNDCIIFHPKVLIFETVPIWKARKQSKTLKITNPGPKTHRVVIKRLQDGAPSKNSKFDLDKCIILEDIGPFNAFAFSRYFLEIPPNTEQNLKVTFKNADYVGSYLEQYICEIYKESNKADLHYVGNEEVLVMAETTGHILRPCPDVLDFDQCVFDSVYQRNFQLHNDDGIPHQIQIKIPARLKDYVSTTSHQTRIQAFGHQTVWIRLVPRRDMPYFNVETAVLEFPIRVCLVGDAPCVVVTAYAVVSDSVGLVLDPVDLGDRLIDLGTCTTAETVWAPIALTNRSSTQQHFGFLDLPQCVFVEPNFGFGVLEPMESRVLNVMVSPEVSQLEASQVTFRISVHTIKELGGVKKVIGNRKLRKSLEMIETVLEAKGVSSLEKDMLVLVATKGQNHLGEVQSPLVADGRSLGKLGDVNDNSSDPTLTAPLELGAHKSSPDVTEASTASHLPFDEKGQDAKNVNPALELSAPNNSRDVTESSSKQPMSNQHFGMAKTNSLMIRYTIIDCLCSFSHQQVIFPSTPCGSYSMASVNLSAKQNSRGRHQNKPIGTYKANFKIMGNNNQFRIEPTCGELKFGEVVKITLVARPELPEALIDAKATLIQRQNLKQSKESERKRNQFGKKEQDKSAKKKGSRQKSSEEEIEPSKGDEERQPPVDDKDIVIAYPGEMYFWREFEPYYIFGQFTCEISYVASNLQARLTALTKELPKPSKQKPEKLYLNAVCQVIPPDFVHNLKHQNVNFGPTPLGMLKKHVVEVQNIKRQPIGIKIMGPCPIGPYTCPDVSRVELPPEHRLQIPITFQPTELKEIREYIEIISGKTTCRLVLSGQGVQANITISPVFLVCHLEANPNGFADVALEVKNHSAGPIVINFDKVCELEGEIQEVFRDGGKEKSSKAKKLSKFSDQLTPDEIYSLENFFQRREGPSLFEVVGGKSVEICSESKQSVNLRFGNGNPSTLDKDGNRKDGGKKRKEKAIPKKLTRVGEGKCYVAKFNVMLGNSKFLKDFIAIGRFV